MKGSHHMSRSFRIVIALALVASTLLVVAGGARASSTARGTYVLEQAGSVAELNLAAPSISLALANNGVLGLTVRVPWNILEPSFGVYDFTILDRAKQLAGTKRLTVRFMAGRYTPSFRLGNSFVYSGSATGGLGAGSRVPLPFTQTGGVNTTFEAGWKALVDRLIIWARNNGVTLLHFSWPGLLWAELALIDEMMRQPGYSYAIVRDMHFRMIDYALAHTGSLTSVEFPSTGHCPNQLLMDIRSHILALPQQGRVILQSNNLSPTSGGVMSSPPRRAGQVVSASNSYNWALVFQKVRSISAEYVEVYTESFSGGTSQQLKTQIASFYSP